jgi:hypothetical protein
MKANKALEKMRKNKHVLKTSNWAGRYSIPLVFVALFMVLGTYTLLRSRAAAGNDLVVTNITMTPANPAAGQAVTFSATVKNQGTTPTTAGTAVGVGFSVDGQKVTWNRTNTSSLAAGASITLAANAGSSGATWAATAGPHTLTATADDVNAIPDEADESNNNKNLGFTIGNTGNLYSLPASANALLNSNVTVDVRLTPGVTVDGVDATLTYDQAKLQFVSIDPTGSPFDVELGAQTGGSGSVHLTRGNLSGGVSADGLVAKVTFKALTGTGNATIQVAGNATKGGVYTNPSTANTTVNFSTPDSTAPTVSITSPANNATVFSNQTIAVTAADAVGVTKTELYIDGQLKATDNATPYSFVVDTRTLSNATHTLQAKAYDSAGNIGNSAIITITVKNWNEDINQDGQVNLLDFSLLASKFGQNGAGLGRPDINGDGTVNLLDFSLLAGKFGK